MPKKTFIRGKLESVTSQRQQYKPYGYNLLPTEVYVEIEVPADTVLETWQTDEGLNAIVLDLNGFKAILSKLADAVDEVHNDYTLKAQRSGRF